MASDSQLHCIYSFRRNAHLCLVLRLPGEKHMFELYVCLYLGVGLIVAGFVFAMFPPVPDHKPGWPVVILGAATYVLLWPFLALLGLGYSIGQACCRMSEQDTMSGESSATGRRLSLSCFYDESQIRN